MLAWLIYFSIPAVVRGAVSLVRPSFSRPHRMIGRPNEIRALYDVSGGVFSIQSAGEVLILQAWSEPHELPWLCRRLTRFSSMGTTYGAAFRCFLVYVGESAIHELSARSSTLATCAWPLLFDRDGVFPRFFGSEFKAGSLIVDRTGTIRCVPGCCGFGSERRVLKAILSHRPAG
jgi:hypothetical protein